MSKYKYVYTHIPFCDITCHYCDFYSVRTKEARHDDFFHALGKEATGRIHELAPALETLYFGGGTPSVSPPDLLHAYIDLFRSRITSKTEITIEANPNTITQEKVRAWKAAGINRVSVGVQSLDDAQLKSLGRAHSAAKAIESAEIVLSEIPNVSVDFIYGVPNQEISWPGDHAARMADLGVKHVSAYHLTLEPEHFMYKRVLPGDIAIQQAEHLLKKLSAYQFEQYEISSFSPRGFESKHNRAYWDSSAYMAFGPSAHGFDGKNIRWMNMADWMGYVERVNRGESPISEREELSREERFTETVFTSLRTREGLSLQQIENDYQKNILKSHELLIERLVKDGLATLSGNALQLSFRGMMLADEITQKIISPHS